MSQSQQKPRIVRKSVVPEDKRTQNRDIAAEIIEQEWPATLGEIAEASKNYRDEYDSIPEDGYSVSHIHNTLKNYFDRKPRSSSQGSGQEAVADTDAQAQGDGGQPNQGPQGPSAPTPMKVANQKQITIPDEIDTQGELLAYLKGWGEGFVSCQNELLEDEGGNEEIEESRSQA